MKNNRNPAHSRSAKAESSAPLSHEQEKIRKWLSKVKFKKAFLGGVRESDVWKKLEELNAMYEAALSAERARYDALLAEHTQSEAKRLALQMYRQAMAKGQQREMTHEQQP